MSTQIDRITGLVGNLGVKAPCNCASVGALTLVGEQTVDGYACTAADNGGMGTRVLYKDDPNPVLNGIYYCNTGAWQRAPDFDGQRDVAQGTRVFVTGVAGVNTNANVEFEVTTANPINVGTSGITFASYLATSFAPTINAAPAKNPLVAADKFGIWDSVTGLLKSFSLGNLLAQVLALFSAPSGSSLIGYQPAGIGAVATTVQTELHNAVYITDFAANGVSGAPVDPTGMLDSTLGIQAAFTASNHVIVPANCTPLISASINVPAFARLTFLGGTGNAIGAYPSSYFIKKSTMTTAGIVVNQGAVVDYGGVVGQGGNTGSGIALVGNAAKSYRNFVALCGGDGIRIGADTGAGAAGNYNACSIEFPQTIQNGGHGIRVHDGQTLTGAANANAITILHPVSRLNAGNGIHLGFAWWVTVTGGNSETNTGWGVNCSGVANNTYPECRWPSIIGGDWNEGNGVASLTSVAITGTAGQFSCASAFLAVGMSVTISGTFGGTGSITGYINPTTYYITATNGSTTFTLSTTQGGTGVVTTAGAPTGLTYTTSAQIYDGSYFGTFINPDFNSLPTNAASGNSGIRNSIGGYGNNPGSNIYQGLTVKTYMLNTAVGMYSLGDIQADNAAGFVAWYLKSSLPGIYGRVAHTGDSSGLLIQNINNSSNTGITFSSGATGGAATVKTYIRPLGTLVNYFGRALAGNAKTISALAATTTQTIPAGQQYTYFTTTAASMQTTLPAANAAIDGLEVTLVSNISIATATWVSSGATFVGAPAAFTANVPVKMIYDHASTQWLPA